VKWYNTKVTTMSNLQLGSNGVKVMKEVNGDDDDNEPTYRNQFRCLALEVGELIDEYLINGLEQEEAHRFEDHLLLCLYCQAEVIAFRAIVREWRNNPQQYFGRQGRKKIGFNGAKGKEQEG